MRSQSGWGSCSRRPAPPAGLTGRPHPCHGSRRASGRRRRARRHRDLRVGGGVSRHRARAGGPAGGVAPGRIAERLAGTPADRQRDPRGRVRGRRPRPGPLRAGRDRRGAARGRDRRALRHPKNSAQRHRKGAGRRRARCARRCRALPGDRLDVGREPRNLAFYESLGFARDQGDGDVQLRQPAGGPLPCSPSPTATSVCRLRARFRQKPTSEDSTHRWRSRR